MRIVVVLQEQIAQEMRAPSRGRDLESTSVDAQELQVAASELGISLSPMYPEVSHPTLQPFFIIEVPDQAIAQKVITRLSKSAAVEAAYLQPDAEPPGLP
ncbi:MAG: hypothetical protein A2W35_16025 [Chloroflexi bacterium RBG_16_57_11]|nr:MAG: hypothetical protein A2W35_16025 [Chloroflexi bacterium RBG_16_57_11]